VHTAAEAEQELHIGTILLVIIPVFVVGNIPANSRGENNERLYPAMTERNFDVGQNFVLEICSGRFHIIVPGGESQKKPTPQGNVISNRPTNANAQWRAQRAGRYGGHAILVIIQVVVIINIEYRETEVHSKSIDVSIGCGLPISRRLCFVLRQWGGLRSTVFSGNCHFCPHTGECQKNQRDCDWFHRTLLTVDEDVSLSKNISKAMFRQVIPERDKKTQ
jgi:hypothetical protein